MTKTVSKTQDKTKLVGEHRILHANFEPTKTKDLGEGVIEAIITSGAIDHHNERINIDGVDTSAYHGPVLYGHDYEGLPIGKTLSLTKMKSKIKAKFQLAIQEYPFAGLIYNMIKGGYLTDVSIGGIVKRWNDDYTVIEEMTMKEFSVVPIGANEEAMITAVKSLDISREQIRDEYKNFAKSVLLDNVSDMSHDELIDAIKEFKTLAARLEEVLNDPPSADAKTNKRIKKRLVLKDAQAVTTQGQKIIKIVKLSI